VIERVVLFTKFDHSALREMSRQKTRTQHEEEQVQEHTWTELMPEQHARPVVPLALFSFCFVSSNITFRYPEFALEAWVGKSEQTGLHTLLRINIMMYIHLAYHVLRDVGRMPSFVVRLGDS
jgi:hypothetical protein